MSWQEKLAAVGLDESNMPNMIKKAVSDLKAFQKEANKITSLLEDESLSDAKREKLEDDYDTLVESIESQEDVIEKKIDQWNKNKDGYAKRGEALKAAKLAKQQAKQEGVTTSTSQATPPPQPPQPPTQPQVVSVEAEEIKPTEKKGGGWGWLVLVGIVAIASLGVINISKDE